VKVFVKICGVTTLEDAHAAVEAGADALGFNFYRPSPRYIEPARAREIVGRLPAGTLAVGVFVNEEARAVETIARESGVAAVQLHGDESPEFCASLAAGRVIKALRVGPDFTPERAAVYPAEAILLDAFIPSARGGTGHTFDWTLARLTRERVGRLILAGGLTTRNVAEAIRAVRPYGVDACSGIESGPGRKSVGLMREFVAAVRSVDD